jgi:hypothetical protein
MPFVSLLAALMLLLFSSSFVDAETGTARVICKKPDDILRIDFIINFDKQDVIMRNPVLDTATMKIRGISQTSMRAKKGIRRFDNEVIAWVEGIDQYELQMSSLTLIERGSAMAGTYNCRRVDKFED